MFDLWVALLLNQMVQNLHGILETQVQSLGWEEPLEKGMGTHPSILAWEILWAEEPGRLQSLGSKRVRQDLATKQHPRVCICRFQPPSPSYPSNSSRIFSHRAIHYWAILGYWDSSPVC